MTKEIKKAIDDLFNEMIDAVKVNGLQKRCSHIAHGKSIYLSDTILDYRGKCLEISKKNPYGWDLSQRNEFTQGFGRKTTPYLWLKKELISN